MIRDLLRRFQRLVYVAYTATPFANILIPHDTFDPQVATDLYPRDFIVDLPKPRNYFGAEELFGRFDRATNDEVGGLDVIRNIPETDLDALDGGSIPETLQTALLDFVLAGAARAQRGQGDAPGTMLVHVSQIILEQFDIATRISQHFSEIRDEWRYHRTHGIRERLRIRWNHEFRPVVRAVHPDKDVRFEQVERFIGPFFESTAVRVINSATGEVLDYEREPNLKAVAVGGNRLSRGLTLEGLLISYFVRPTTMYDTLMQMGRWFGFRNGYEDLTRIYMPSELAGWFTDMALVEFELRQDIQIYESHDLTPLQLSARILRNPAMLVTSRAKQRFASSITVEQSYSASVEQTVRFPLSQPVSLGPLLENNLAATRMLVGQLSEPKASSAQKAVWLSVSPDVVLSFLRAYRVDSEVRNLSLPLICNYIERQRELGELTNWTISIRGRESEDTALGRIDLGSPGGPINLLARTRLKSDGDSLGVITTPGDEEEGLSTEQMERARLRQQEQDMGVNPAARRERPATDGLLLLYPISHLSGYALQPGASRRRLFDDPSASYAQDIIGLAISFPYSSQAQTITGQYMVGTVGWRPV